MSDKNKKKRRQQLSDLARLILWKPWFRSLKGPGESGAWVDSFVVTLNLQDGSGNRHFHSPDLMTVVREAIQFLVMLRQSGDPQ